MDISYSNFDYTTTWLGDTTGIFKVPPPHVVLPGTGGEPNDCEAVPVGNGLSILLLMVLLLLTIKSIKRWL